MQAALTRLVLTAGLALVAAGTSAAQCQGGCGPHHHHAAAAPCQGGGPCGGATAAAASSPAGAKPPAPALTIAVPGIATFHPVTPTVALGSHVGPDSLPALRAAGVQTVISLRVDGEPGFDREALAAAARQAGLGFVSIPFDAAHPDPGAVRRFLEVMASPQTGPTFVSCHSGQRAAMMWSLERISEGWDVDRALAEAHSLGLSKPELERFVREFSATAR
jgi:uncharacterized protein (TIGR01244 family)